MVTKKDVGIWIAILAGGIFTFFMYGFAAELTR